MKKIIALLCLVCTLMSCLAGCSEDSKHIGNPYVPEYFTLDGVEYHMEYDNIAAKLEENGWSFTPDGKNVTVYKDVEYQKNKSQKGYYHSEFQLVLKKDASSYDSINEYDVTNIIFKDGDLLVHFDILDVKLDSAYEDVYRKFGNMGKIGYKEETGQVPRELTYKGKTRNMVLSFDNGRLTMANFSL